MEHTSGGQRMSILDGFIFAFFPQKVYEIDTLGKKFTFTHNDDNSEDNDHEEKTQDTQAFKR